MAAAAGGEAVEAVGEVHAVRGARQHQEDQHRVGQPEVDRARRRRAGRACRGSSTYSVATSQSAIAVSACTASFVLPETPSERRLRSL